MEFTYPFGLDRRELLKSMIAAPLLAQGPNPVAIATAEGQRQAAGKTAGMKFKALVRHGNELTTETLTMRPIHPQQVVIRNQAAQTCYTTTAALNTANRAANAVVAGHGGVGTVEEVGAQVRRVQVGDQVIMSITPQCGACANCLNGRADICAMFGRPAIPQATMADGTPVQMANGPSGFSEYLVTWEEFVVPVFTKIPPVELSLLACVSACGLGLAMCRFPVEAGSDVVVFGLGPVGLSAVQGARIQGATRIIGIDPIKYRRDLAMKVGATAVIDSNADRGSDLIGKVNNLTVDVVPQGRFFAGQQRAPGPMYVLEAVGGTRFPLPAGVESPFDMTGTDALQQCYTAVRGGGYVRTCSVGHPPNATVSFPAARWANSSKTHVPGNFAGVQALRDIPRFVKLIEKGLFDAKSMIGKTYPGTQMREALQAAADRSVISSVIVYS